VDERLGDMLAAAFREVPAREANEAIARARRERAGGDPDDEDSETVRSYEIVLSSWEHFVREQLPKLVYHLESLGAHLPACSGVMVSAFPGERLFFIDASALIDRVCALLGLTAGQLVEWHGLGERRTAIREPLLLPGAKGTN